MAKTDDDKKKSLPIIIFKRKRRRKKNKRKFLLAPRIDNLDSLIEIAKSNIPYSNIDVRRLWNALPNLERLNSIIGMNSLKQTVFLQIVYYLKLLHKKGNEEYLHTILIGSPGCGKTMVAEIIGNIYKDLGILSKKGVFKIARREDFIGQYVGQSEHKTMELLNSCKGGVLFIDEAYALGMSDTFSKSIINILNAFLSENKNNFCCILAGYEQDLNRCFFDKNSGLRSRFQWTHRIDSYDEADLSRIFIKKIKDIEWHCELSETQIQRIIEDNKELFKSYGRDIENLVTKCKISHGKRIFHLDDKHSFIITREDIDNAISLIREHNTDDNNNAQHLSMYS